MNNTDSQPTAVDATLIVIRAGRPETHPLDGLLPPGRATDIGGDRNAPKHELAIALAIAATTGTDWFGFPGSRRRALYVTTERTPDAIRAELAERAKTVGTFVPDAERLRVVGSLHRSGPELVDAIVREVHEVTGGKPDIVFVDAAKTPNDRQPRLRHLVALAGLAPRLDVALVAVCHSPDPQGSESAVLFDSSIRCYEHDRAKNTLRLGVVGPRFGELSVSILKRGRRGLERA